MKKIFALICVVLMTLCLAACDNTSKDGWADMPNPIVEVSSLDELNQKLGCWFAKPSVMGVTNETFSIIGEHVGQYTFEINGVPVTYRFSPMFNEEISGYYINGKDAFGDKLDETGLVFVLGDDAKLARFVNVDGQYVVIVEDGGTLTDEQFQTIVEDLRTQISYHHETPEGGTVAGQYIDSTSGRAVLDVVDNGDGTWTLTVNWGQTADTLTRWVLVCSFISDEFCYIDGEKYEITYDTDGNEKSTLIADDLVGQFDYKDGKIYWVQAEDENLMNCVFVKNEAEQYTVE